MAWHGLESLVVPHRRGNPRAESPRILTPVIGEVISDPRAREILLDLLLELADRWPALDGWGQGDAEHSAVLKLFL